MRTPPSSIITAAAAANRGHSQQMVSRFLHIFKRYYIGNWFQKRSMHAHYFLFMAYVEVYILLNDGVRRLFLAHFDSKVCSDRRGWSWDVFSFLQIIHLPSSCENFLEEKYYNEDSVGVFFKEGGGEVTKLGERERREVIQPFRVKCMGCVPKKLWFPPSTDSVLSFYVRRSNHVIFQSCSFRGRLTGVVFHCFPSSLWRWRTSFSVPKTYTYVNSYTSNVSQNVNKHT